MLTYAVVHPRNSISSLVDGREEVSLSPIRIMAYLFRFAGSVRCVDRSGLAFFAPPHISLPRQDNVPVNRIFSFQDTQS